MKRLCIIAAVAGQLLATTAPAASLNQSIGVNVLLKTAITPDILADLARFGTVAEQMPAINALTLKTTTGNLSSVQTLPYVAAANPDLERKGSPVDGVSVTDYTTGLNTWNLDAVDVTDFGSRARQVAQDGSGVYVAILDTGLLDSWRQYFPQERIAVQYATSFGGGGGEVGNVSTQPNKWEHDQNSHGTHVTSTILGYSLGTTPINGVAPKATVIPVKVLNQNGSGWSSVVARGIVYAADLKAGPLAGSPVIISMSLGGPGLDAVEKAAMDYAIAKGVIIVAAAGNEGTAGMGYPGAYKPVISVAASGWVGEWVGSRGWWYNRNVADPINVNDFYIAGFSSRELPGQELDIAAPGSWVVGPYQVNSGQLSYYFLGGTSMATPHVSGVVALMAQKKPSLTASEAEAILKSTATKLPPGSRNVSSPSGIIQTISWNADATGAGLINTKGALGAVIP